MGWVNKILGIIGGAMRASHSAHAAIAIEHDWPSIVHGIIPVTTVFAVYILVETGQHVWKAAVRTRRERAARRAAAAEQAAAAIAADDD